MQRNPNPNNLPVELNRTSLYLGLLFVRHWHPVLQLLLQLIGSASNERQEIFPA